MYVSIPTKEKTLWTHTSLIPEENHNQIVALQNGEGSFVNKLSFLDLYLTLEIVNRVKPIAHLHLYYRAGIVGAAFLGSRFLASAIYKRSIQSDINKLVDGAPVWEDKYLVPELDKKFFFLDDDNNFQPSLWHHGITSIEKPTRFYRA